MEQYEEEIRERCEMYDVDPDTLTQEEKERLVYEIEAEDRGELISHPILQQIIMREPAQ